MIKTRVVRDKDFALELLFNLLRQLVKTGLPCHHAGRDTGQSLDIERDKRLGVDQAFPDRDLVLRECFDTDLGNAITLEI